MSVPRRRVTLALLASTLLHVLGLWLVDVLAPDPRQAVRFEARLPARRVEVERLQIRPPVPVSREWLERLRLAEGPRPIVEVEQILVEGDSLAQWEVLLQDEAAIATEQGGKTDWEGGADSVRVVLGAKEQVTELPPAPDPVELDAMRRQKTIVLIDPETGKLRRAYLHIPARMGENRLEKLLWNLKHGGMLAWKTPIDYKVRYTRRPLHLSEVREYPVVFLEFVELQSADTLVDYVMGGGVIMGGPLEYIYAQLQPRLGQRLQQVQLTLEHPLFRSYYDISDYAKVVGPSNGCAPVEPLSGLELDGRLVALSGVSYTPLLPCIANKLYVNAMAFLLIQPSPMGGRYMAKVRE